MPAERDVSCVLITGAAGFIGYSVTRALLSDGGMRDKRRVVGVDNLNSYYPVKLKQDRLTELSRLSGFSFEMLDIADDAALKSVFERYQPDSVLHLAAQTGVRYSIENPFAYARSNLLGHLSVLEACRRAEPRPRLVYASSSSVYGGNTK